MGKGGEETLLLDNLLNTLPDLVWLKDLKGRYIACNRPFERLLGLKKEQIVGRTDSELYGKEAAQKFQHLDKEAIRKGFVRLEEYLVFADGYEGYFETIKKPMYDEKGRAVGIVGIARDITAQKEQIDAFNEAQAIAHIGSWKLDLKTNRLRWSDECYRIFGIKIGTPVTIDTFLSKVHEEDRQRVIEAWERALRGERYDIDHRIVVNGRVKWVRERAKLVYNARGEATWGIGTVQDITLFKAYETRLLCMANTDSLTGLANRTMLLSLLEKSIAAAVREGARCALLLFDLDNFKDINDSFGHQIGDEVLKAIADRLKKRLRRTDLVARLCEGEPLVEEKEAIARLGGDEFVVLLTAIKEARDAEKVAKEIMSIIEKPVTLSNGRTVHVTASVGIAVAPDHATDPAQILQYADSALYKAKNDGRITMAYYTDELTRQAKERLEEENRLRRALEQEEFVLFYQPQVHIATGRVVGFEALIRWHDPQRGMITPDRFIPIAERSGLLIPIGEWVMKEAFRQSAAWRAKGLAPHICVNVSANQLNHSDLTALMERLLERYDTDPSHITIELTESTLMNREDRLVTTLHRLRAMGFKIAIDDFGTGYSSYSYLKRFPVDMLKIDKSFIDDIPYDKENSAIVKAIVAMGRALDYQLLAEGVERPEQLAFLKEIGCDFYQGFLKSAPLPPAEAERMLENDR